MYIHIYIYKYIYIYICSLFVFLVLFFLIPLFFYIYNQMKLTIFKVPIIFRHDFYKLNLQLAWVENKSQV